MEKSDFYITSNFQDGGHDVHPRNAAASAGCPPSSWHMHHSSWSIVQSYLF